MGAVMSKNICVLALSAIADDPRVRRQADAFFRKDWCVTAVGLPGAKSQSPDWPILTRSDDPNGAATSHIPASTERSAFRKRLLSLFRVTTKPFFANEGEHQLFERRIKRIVGHTIYVLISVQKSARQKANGKIMRQKTREQIFWDRSPAVHDLYRCAEQVGADVWLANDWTMLPVAARLASKNGGIYGYDTHEFATEEYAENRAWRLFQRPIVSAIEKGYIAGAVVVSAVSSGIAERLDALYDLKRPSLTIRNTPIYQEVPFRPTRRDRIDVLYHGIVVPNRGLEAAVESVSLWRPDFTLTIRGPENPEFTPVLRARIAALGLQDRVRLVPAVPMTALVEEAAASDIGFFALPGHSLHNEFALPNKFFEYVMAGLALCTTDLPEMARLIHKYDLGLTIGAVEPVAIAAAINALDPDRIDRFKRNALAAANELCWERESERLVAAYDGALVAARAKTS